MLKVTKMSIPEVLILEYNTKLDNRGSSQRLFSKKELDASNIKTEFVEQIIYTSSKACTLYGIHFQNNPKAQTKLLYCLKGKGIDYAVDLRKNSPTYKKWISIELNETNNKQIYIPKGFGHAFLSLEDNTQVVINIDNYFDSNLSQAIIYNDPEININYAVSNLILSKNDKNALPLKKIVCNL